MKIIFSLSSIEQERKRILLLPLFAYTRTGRVIGLSNFHDEEQKGEMGPGTLLPSVLILSRSLTCVPQTSRSAALHLNLSGQRCAIAGRSCSRPQVTAAAATESRIPAAGLRLQQAQSSLSWLSVACCCFCCNNILINPAHAELLGNGCSRSERRKTALWVGCRIKSLHSLPPIQHLVEGEASQSVDHLPRQQDPQFLVVDEHQLLVSCDITLYSCK